MTVKNKLDKPFGPAGSFAGILIFIVGLIITLYELSGLILITVGAFIGFTSTSVKIDLTKKRVKLSNNLFGILPVGQWIAVSPEMKIGIIRSNKVWRTYSRSNRSTDLRNNDIVVVLYNAIGEKIMYLKKTPSLNSAKQYVDNLTDQLGVAAQG
ncbi:MAG: hypothetical protein JXB49_02270 [Bacteroidales bacterium]|nr:hypothetical protein [Bacteroidales bacterium]